MLCCTHLTCVCVCAVDLFVVNTEKSTKTRKCMEKLNKFLIELPESPLHGFSRVHLISRLHLSLFLYCFCCGGVFLFAFLYTDNVVARRVPENKINSFIVSRRWNIVGTQQHESFSSRTVEKFKSLFSQFTLQLPIKKKETFSFRWRNKRWNKTMAKRKTPPHVSFLVVHSYFLHSSYSSVRSMKQQKQHAEMRVILKSSWFVWRSSTSAKES